MERDPHGKNPHEGGAKLDAGKPWAGRILKQFDRALLAVAEVGTFGARKYSLGGWLTVPDGYGRYQDAMMRHFLQDGVDPDSGLLHAAHAAWNALAILQFELEAIAHEETNKFLNSREETICKIDNERIVEDLYTDPHGVREIY